MSDIPSPNEQFKAAQDFAAKSTEQTTAQATATLDAMSGEAKKTVDTMKNASTSAFSAACEYNAKLMEFAVANSKASMDWAQKLSELKSPGDVMSAMSAHAKDRFQVFADQAKELSSLAARIVPQIGDKR
jgi:hypothetical protein